MCRRLARLPLLLMCVKSGVRVLLCTLSHLRAAEPWRETPSGAPSLVILCIVHMNRRLGFSPASIVSVCTLTPGTTDPGFLGLKALCSPTRACSQEGDSCLGRPQQASYKAVLDFKTVSEG